MPDPLASKHFDVIVVGVGAMGSATCYELARRGARVLGLEQFGIPHDRGSSHGHTRMIRLAYYEHADYVPLLRRAYENWRQIEAVSGDRLLHITGGIYAGPRQGELVAQSARSARAHGIDHELLDRAQIAQRFPQFRLPDDYIGLFEPTTGFVRPEAAIRTYVKHARQAGAEIRENTPVREWLAQSDRATIKTDSETFTAAKLVFTGGPWTSKIVGDIGIPLVVTRQLLGWVRPMETTPFSHQRFACWAVEQPDGSLYYGAPINEFDPGLKIAHHHRGPIADPDTVSREPTKADEDSIHRIVADVLPGAAAGSVVELRVCLYTISPDSHFILGQHPQHKHLLLACGFSGHGFKFASVIGEVMSDLALQGLTRLPIEFLSPRRFL